ncbi:MAG: hypothetical protein HQM16_12575 [Deltaproteobacteria bacterium]|nr:hypothetical protein [Deltaproteobacteria bacterium]
MPITTCVFFAAISTGSGGTQHPANLADNNNMFSHPLISPLNVAASVVLGPAPAATTQGVVEPLAGQSLTASQYQALLAARDCPQAFSTHLLRVNNTSRRLVAFLGERDHFLPREFAPTGHDVVRAFPWRGVEAPRMLDPAKDYAAEWQRIRDAQYKDAQKRFGCKEFVYSMLTAVSIEGPDIGTMDAIRAALRSQIPQTFLKEEPTNPSHVEITVSRGGFSRVLLWSANELAGFFDGDNAFLLNGLPVHFLENNPFDMQRYERLLRSIGLGLRFVPAAAVVAGLALLLDISLAIPAGVGAATVAGIVSTVHSVFGASRMASARDLDMCNSIVRYHNAEPLAHPLLCVMHTHHADRVVSALLRSGQFVRVPVSQWSQT